jgi:hypothetical protein
VCAILSCPSFCLSKIWVDREAARVHKTAQKRPEQSKIPHERMNSVCGNEPYSTFRRMERNHITIRSDEYRLPYVGVALSPMKLLWVEWMWNIMLRTGAYDFILCFVSVDHIAADRPPLRTSSIARLQHTTATYSLAHMYLHS